MLGILIQTIVGAMAPLVLKIVGFTSSGVAANSIAAIIQSCIGNVVRGSLFAVLTSMGATGALLGLPLTIVGGLTGTVLGTIKYLIWWF